MSATLPHRIKPHIRWMIRRDLPEVTSSELASTADPWSEDDFLRVLRQRNHIGMIAEYRENVVGHMVYRLERDRLVVPRLVVDRDFRRVGVGTSLVTKLLSKLSAHRRPTLVIPCPDACLDAHLFLKTMGLRATMVRDGDEHSYQFVATCEPPPEAPAGALLDCGGEGASEP